MKINGHFTNLNHQSIKFHMKYLYKVFILLILVFLCSDSLFSQYLDDNGEVLKDKIIEELQQLPDASPDQRALADSIVTYIRNEISGHPVLQDNSDLRMEGFSTLHHMVTRLGDFTFLRGSSELSTWEHQRKLDTISAEVLAIESQIQSLNDSLYALYDQLIDITQREKLETRATKEKAALMIGKSPFYDHIEYIFENHENLVFGLVLDQFGDADTDFGEYRSGMVGLISGFTGSERDYYSWRTMPFLLKYWGDSDWATNHDPGFEVLLFFTLMQNFDNEKLLLEFMRANAKDPDTFIYKRLNKILTYK